jgi:hypothetical protein
MTRIVLKPTLFVAQSDEFRSKSGSLQAIRLKPALLPARSGKSTRIVLKPTLFVAQSDGIRSKSGSPQEIRLKPTSLRYS